MIGTLSNLLIGGRVEGPNRLSLPILTKDGLCQTGPDHLGLAIAEPLPAVEVPDSGQSLGPTSLPTRVADGRARLP